MRRFLREPLLHFLCLGAALFGLYGWLNRALPGAQNEIVVSRGQLQSLQAQFERVRQRAATPEELQGLLDNWIREEIFYREGLAMGLDRDDPVVRRRVGQKLEFILDGMTPAAPSTEELQAWLDTHQAAYRIEATYSLRQVYFDPARHGKRLEAEMAAARRALELGESAAGDSTMLPESLQAARAFEVVRIFGSDFTDALETLPVGAWHGPVRSGFGLHLVELTAHQVGRDATLEEVRAEVERDLLQARTREASDAFYERLRSNYTVRIESPGATAADPPG